VVGVLWWGLGKSVRLARGVRYKLLATAKEVLKLAAKLIKLSVNYIAGEYAVSVLAVGQLIFLACTSLPDFSNLFARHLAFFAALSFA
jgi:hypothetical protein